MRKGNKFEQAMDQWAVPSVILFAVGVMGWWLIQMAITVASL